jgi:NAD(P)-dependent dehydrogenase (short-subunit alcohol dehydrogenase family)
MLTVVISGASKGIGKFLFNHYHSIGIETYGTYLHTKPIDLPKDRFFQVDVSNPISINSLIENLKLKDSKIILINCAGINYNSFAHKSNVNEWSKVIDVNLKGAFYMSQAFLPIMRENQYGRLIFFSSVVAQIGVPGTSAYATSKAGLWGLSKVIAKENASKGITSNCINLGYFDIGMIKDVPEKMQEDIKSSIPTKKFGNPNNLISILNYLVESDYTTGSNLDCNGGLI